MGRLFVPISRKAQLFLYQKDFNGVPVIKVFTDLDERPEATCLLSQACFEPTFVKNTFHSDRILADVGDGWIMCDPIGAVQRVQFLCRLVEHGNMHHSGNSLH